MTVLATDKKRLSNLVKAELFPEKAFCRTVVTMNDAAATLAIGTVLGKVTATGKYKVCVQTAVDGSQTAAAILMQDLTLAATTDTPVLAMTRGPASVSKGALVLDATHNLDAEKLAIYTALEALNIQVLETA
jgi:hypothetical protein